MTWLVRTSKDLGGRPPLASRCISLSWLFFHGGNTGSNSGRGTPNLFKNFKSADIFSRGHGADEVLPGRPRQILRFRGQQNIHAPTFRNLLVPPSLLMWVL